MHIKITPPLPLQAQALRTSVTHYLQYVKLREQALGTLPPTVPAGLEVPQLATLSDIQVGKLRLLKDPDIVPPFYLAAPLPPQTARANEAVWLDMTTSEDDDMNSWCMAGYTLVARGQAAVLLVASECGEGGGDEGKSSK